MLKPGSSIGILGGGQLGKMIAIAAANLGYKTHIYCPEANSPALQVANHYTIANYNDQAALESFAESNDIITLEFENIPYESIKFINSKNKLVCPNWQSLYIAQNRLREKEFANSLGISTTKFALVNDQASCVEAMYSLKTPFILKTLEQGYDGKGQIIIYDEQDIKDALSALSTIQSPKLLAEAWVNYDKEISIIIARNKHGQVSTFPCIENQHKRGILDISIMPALVSQPILDQAVEFATKIVNALNLIGLLTIEFFVTKEGKILLNEMSPRPHNSGHLTIDACITSQFEQLIRAICDLPFGSTSYHSKATMKNLIGLELNNWENYIKEPNNKLYIYGKDEIKESRKMGHVTTLLST